MGIFTQLRIILELASDTNSKKKKDIRNLILENDGIISYIVTKQCNLLVTNNVEKLQESHKCRTAFKYEIPVVSVEYLYACTNDGVLLPPEPHMLVSSETKAKLDTGVINFDKEFPKSTCRGITSLSSVKVWKNWDLASPNFPFKDFYLAKFNILTKNSKQFFAIELHVAPKNEKYEYRYRIQTNSDLLEDKNKECERVGSLKKDLTVCEQRYLSTADDALYVYDKLVQIHLNSPHHYVINNELKHSYIGSQQLQMALNKREPCSEAIDNTMIAFVENLWDDAVGQMQLLKLNFKSIKIQDVDKAASILYNIQQKLSNKDLNQEEIATLSIEFYAVLHISEDKFLINEKHVLTRKLEQCQLLHDMVSVGEKTNWKLSIPFISKLKALKCSILHVPEFDTLFQNIKELIENSSDYDGINILNIYKLRRDVEFFNFNESLGNKRLLFHATNPSNCVGILSRGLLLPKAIVEERGGALTDEGKLGNAIYFTDSARTSVKYSSRSEYSGKRVMFLCDVQLGKTFETYELCPGLNSAPTGFHSVHSIPRSQDAMSAFNDSEYAIYNVNQQCLMYAVEFKLPGDDDASTELNFEYHDDCDDDYEMENDDNVDCKDLLGLEKPERKVKAGLQACSQEDESVKLLTLNVRIQLLDLVAKVIIFQQYMNESINPVEAKFVFPLDEMAAVCGFEAFIDDKHIIGEVKEKEKAHKEYKEALSQGHGAYLMDQDQEMPDIFTVNVGNLPPGKNVLIKLTYITELKIEGDSILFKLPGSIAPWVADRNLALETQDKLASVKLQSSDIETTLHASVQMPFSIRNITSVTHLIRIKKTATKAVVQMAPYQTLSSGFELLIQLAEIHVPRMWVEKHPNNYDSHACMLTFYPQFEERAYENYQIIFFLDLSNSMVENTRKDSLKNAKNLLLLHLHHLPDAVSFNVVVFGTNYEELFPICKPKNCETISAAQSFIKKCQKPMGASDVLDALRSYVELSPMHSLRNIILISDGYLNDESEVLKIASRMRTCNIRILTAGVGDTVNSFLLSNMARYNCGTYVRFEASKKSTWEEKVKDTLYKASLPSLTDIHIEWQNFNDEKVCGQAPAHIMNIFSGSRQVVYGYINNCTQATLKARIGKSEVSTTVSTSELNFTTGTMLHKLTARAILNDWQAGNLADDKYDDQIAKYSTKNDLINLSIEHSIISPFTSFIAVEKRNKNERTTRLTAARQLEIINEESVDFLDYMNWDKCMINIQINDGKLKKASNVNNTRRINLNEKFVVNNFDNLPLADNSLLTVQLTDNTIKDLLENASEEVLTNLFDNLFFFIYHKIEYDSSSEESDEELERLDDEQKHTYDIKTSEELLISCQMNSTLYDSEGGYIESLGGNECEEPSYDYVKPMVNYSEVSICSDVVTDIGDSLDMNFDEPAEQIKTASEKPMKMSDGEFIQIKKIHATDNSVELKKETNVFEKRSLNTGAMRHRKILQVALDTPLALSKSNDDEFLMDAMVSDDLDAVEQRMDKDLVEASESGIFYDDENVYKASIKKSKGMSLEAVDVGGFELSSSKKKKVPTATLR